MRSIRLSIDRLVLRGFGPGEQRALVEGLQDELSRFLADPSARREWSRSRRTPVMKLGRLPLEPGVAGAKNFGADLARRIGRGLKP